MCEYDRSVSRVVSPLQYDSYQYQCEYDIEEEGTLSI